MLRLLRTTLVLLLWCSPLAGSLYARGEMLWSANRHLSPQALQLIDLIRASDTLGLQPEDYGSAQLSATARQLSAGTGTDKDWQDFDYRLNQAAVRLITHLHYGRVEPSAAGFELPARPMDLDVPAAVAALAKARDVGAAVGAVEPEFYHYALLKTALKRYRELAAQPDLTRLPAPGRKAVHPGDAYSGAPALRKLLLALGDLAAGEVPAAAQAAEPRLSPDLVKALKRFQQRHGFTQDGALGAATYAALTVPMTQRVRQIELTMERWRWLPKLETPPIIVNIPQFQLFAFRTTADRVADIQQMPVIVGQSYPRKQTPVFVGALKYVIFRPYWDIPHQITVQEILPQWRARPDYLAHNHFEIIGSGEVLANQARTPATLAALQNGTLRLRQRPGDDNALGLVKFVFPNAHDVYLHGTPARQLFAQSHRAFSHGCIRVADPVALAAYVLRNTPGDWTPQKIMAAMQQSQSLRVNLAQPIKVMILYGTAMATEAGPVDFFDDVYGNDRRLAALLWPATRT
ncbi:MAG: L,D-transpeptidase family protein [Steroidobacteraceae bacterium]